LNIAITHSSLNLCGGAERLSIFMAQTLQDAGNRVAIATLDKTNWSQIQKKFGLTFKPHEEFFLLSNKFETDSFFKRGLLTLASLFVNTTLLKLKRYDLIINTSGEVVNFRGDIVYINAVPFVAGFNSFRGIPIENIRWRCFRKALNVGLRVIDKVNRHSLLLTNSKFNAHIIKKSFDSQALVIYPPVEVKRFIPLSKKRRREDLILSANRVRPGKNLEIIPKVAKIVKNSTFLMVGPSDKASEKTILKLQKCVKQYDVQDRVQLLTNKPISFLEKAMSEAKIFFHTQNSEAFGMAVVEAMAAGCVPVVPRSGGPWFDILDCKQGLYGFSYSNVKEAAEIIDRLLKDDKLRETVAARARKRALMFDSLIFERKILDLVNDVSKRKFERKTE